MHFVFSIYACSLIFFFRSHLFYLLNLPPISNEMISLSLPSCSLILAIKDQIIEVIDIKSHAKLSLSLKNPYREVKNIFNLKDQYFKSFAQVWQVCHC